MPDPVLEALEVEMVPEVNEPRLQALEIVFDIFEAKSEATPAGGGETAHVFIG